LGSRKSISQLYTKKISNPPPPKMVKVSLKELINNFYAHRLHYYEIKWKVGVWIWAANKWWWCSYRKQFRKKNRRWDFFLLFQAIA